MMIKNKYNFFFFFCRTGWRFRLPRSLSSQNRIRFTLQTPTVLRQTLIMLSVRSESFRFFSNRTELLSFVVSCMSILINAFQIVFFFSGYLLQKGLSKHSKRFCISKSFFNWRKSGSNTQFYNCLDWGKKPFHAFAYIVTYETALPRFQGKKCFLRTTGGFPMWLLFPNPTDTIIYQNTIESAKAGDVNSAKVSFMPLCWTLKSTEGCNQ